MGMWVRERCCSAISQGGCCLSIRSESDHILRIPGISTNMIGTVNFHGGRHGLVAGIVEYTPLVFKLVVSGDRLRTRDTDGC